MARLPLIDPETATGDVAAAFAAVPVKLNIFRMMAHAETSIIPQMMLGGAILGNQALGHKERELLILLVAHLEGGAYEWRQHVPIALAVGVSQAEVDALERTDLAAPVFSDSHRALLAFGRQVIEDAHVDDGVFAGVRRHFPPREIVEAILDIGYYMTMTRLTEVTQTDLDASAGMAVFNTAQSPAKE